MNSRESKRKFKTGLLKKLLNMMI